MPPRCSCPELDTSPSSFVGGWGSFAAFQLSARGNEQEEHYTHVQLVTNPSPVGSPTTKIHTNISAHGEHLHGELLPGHSRVLRRRCWGHAPLWPAPRQTAPQRCCGPRPVQRRLLSLDWWLAPDCHRLDIRPFRPLQLYPSRRPSSCIPDRPSGGCEQASKWRRRSGCPLPSLVAATPSAAAPW
jgi:hypothetical protein